MYLHPGHVVSGSCEHFSGVGKCLLNLIGAFRIVRRQDSVAAGFAAMFSLLAAVTCVVVAPVEFSSQLFREAVVAVRERLLWWSLLDLRGRLLVPGKCRR